MSRYFLLIFLLFFGCQNPSPSEKPTFFSGLSMTMEYKVIIGKTLTNKEKGLVEKVISQTFEEANRVYNNWNFDSELSHLNRMQSKIQVPLSPLLHDLLTITDQIVKKTRGYYDPTITPALQLWKKAFQTNTFPSKNEIESLKKIIGWHNIHIDEHGVFSKEYEATSLDLSGIAKGYCVDSLIKNLQKAGFQHVYAEWGGEISVIGNHPSGRSWNIYISNLKNSDPNRAIDIISLNNQAVATSGDYLQQWQIFDTIAKENVFYTHIINPTTLYPLKITNTNICSATVMASTCSVADGLATAAMVFNSTEEVKEWIKELQMESPEIQFWIVQRQPIDY